MDIDKIIGENIAALRKLRGMPQKQLGKIINVGNTAISNYEKGKPINSKNLKKIADYFEVSHADLIKPNIIENIEKLKLRTAEYEKYKGLYYLYYFDINASDSPLKIIQSLLELTADKNSTHLNAVATIGINCYEYYGHFTLHDNRYYVIALDANDGVDSASIFGFMPRTLTPHGINRPYNGGVAFVTSISRETEKIPCFQKIIMSKKPIEGNEDSLRNFLSINEKDEIIKLKEEDDRNFYKFLKNLKNRED